MQRHRSLHVVVQAFQLPREFPRSVNILVRRTVLELYTGRQISPISAFLPIFPYKTPKSRSTFLCAAYSPGVKLKNAPRYSTL